MDYEDLSIIEHYTLDQNNKHSFSSSTVLCIYEDSNDMVWIGTGGEGLFQFDNSINGFNTSTLNFFGRRKSRSSLQIHNNSVSFLDKILSGERYKILALKLIDFINKNKINI